MKLDTKSLHYKIYKRWLQIRTRNYFYNKDSREDVDNMLRAVKDTTTHNLCFYMRVVFFWGPLKMYFFSPTALLTTLNAALFGYIYILLTLPSSTVFLHISRIAMITIATLIAFGLISAGLIVGSEYLREAMAKRHSKEPRPNIIWEWLKAKKRKICPTITFEED